LRLEITEYLPNCGTNQVVVFAFFNLFIALQIHEIPACIVINEAFFEFLWIHVTVRPEIAARLKQLTPN